VFRKLPVRCLPKDIPVKISFDVTELDLDAHIRVADLPLPEGVSIRLAATQTLVAVVTEATGTDDAPVADGAAAPAAAAAAPAADKGAAKAADKGAAKAAPAAKAPAAGKSGGKGK